MWEKLLVTSSKNIGPRVIFGPKSQGSWTYYPAYSLARCVWDIRHLFSFWDHVVCEYADHHLLGISFTHSTNVHECPQSTGGWLRVNPGNVERRRLANLTPGCVNSSLWPLHYTSASFSVLGTQASQLQSLVAHVSSISSYLWMLGVEEAE